MGKSQKLMAGVGAVVLIALLVMWQVGLLPGLGFLVLGGLGVVALMARLPDDDDDDGAPVRAKHSKGRGKRQLDDYLEGQRGTEKKPPTTAPRTGGLPAWNPTALDTWSPPSLSDTEAVAVEEPAGQWDTWDNDWASTGTTDTVEEEEELNPLDALDRLDDIDPIAEVERLDALDQEAAFDPLGALDTATEVDDFDVATDDMSADLAAHDKRPPASGGFSFTSAPAVINESVETADDIMAASQATELELPEIEGDDGADSELARLLAKVQARLAAYE